MTIIHLHKAPMNLFSVLIVFWYYTISNMYFVV